MSFAKSHSSLPSTPELEPILGTSETPHLDALLCLPAAPEHEPVETTVDGRRVVLTAQDEVVLRCGQSSIVLRRNGQVIIRGLQVETRATGLNRIKGGNVQIN